MTTKGCHSQSECKGCYGERISEKFTDLWVKQKHRARLYVYTLLSIVARMKKEILSDQLLQQPLWILTVDFSSQHSRRPESVSGLMRERAAEEDSGLFGDYTQWYAISWTFLSKFYFCPNINFKVCDTLLLCFLKIIIYLFWIEMSFMCEAFKFVKAWTRHAILRL